MMIVTTRSGMMYDIHSGVLITPSGTCVPDLLPDRCLLCNASADSYPLSHGICFNCLAESDEATRVLRVLIAAKELSYVIDQQEAEQKLLVIDEQAKINAAKWEHLRKWAIRKSNEQQRRPRKPRNDPGTT